MQPLENPCRVIQGLHGDCIERFFLKNLYCLECSRFCSGFGSRSRRFERNKKILPHPRVSIVGSLRDREVACSASDRQGSNFESCVWRTVSSQSSHHPQEVLLAQFSLYVRKGGLKPDSFHFFAGKTMIPALKEFKKNHGRRPIAYVFKWSRKSYLRHLWWFQIVKPFCLHGLYKIISVL